MLNTYNAMKQIRPPTKAYKRIYPDTETNRRNANLNIR